jgi:hypothetical protein
MRADLNDTTPPFDLRNLKPQPNSWLETDLKYEGYGTAELASPKGTIAGPFVAKFNEYASPFIETVFETATPCDPSYEGNAFSFISGATPQRAEGVTSWGFSGMKNPCERLEFATESGTFVSTGKVDWAGMNWGTEPTRLRFSVREGKFETQNQEPAKYFVIPLFNCVAELTNVLYGEHPLRIFPTPSIPINVPPEKRVMANMIANEKNSVLGFSMDGRVCFIERVPDYEAHVAALRSGAARRKITAVLVGDVGTNPVATLADFRSWFPHEILSALSFASGVEVGWPWVEIRDEKGSLIRRLHGGTRTPAFSGGDDVFGQFSRPGAGDFITRYVLLSNEKRSYLEVVMNHVRLGSLGSPLHLHDLLDHLVRALDCLCREHKFTRQDLMSLLSVEAQDKVGQLTSEITTKLRQLGDEANQSGNLDDYRILTTIASRAASVAQTENKLGLAAVALLKKFGLPDADVIDAFLASKGRPDWATLISIYRNATVHEGYLDFTTKHDAREVIQLCAHLKDVLTRIVLKECDYDGSYDSVLRHSFGPQPIDWVRADTDPSDLHFT